MLETISSVKLSNNKIPVHCNVHHIGYVTKTLGMPIVMTNGKWAHNSHKNI